MIEFLYEKTRFQLHHTGIKTGGLGQRYRGGFEFQLHHTGIKTLNAADCKRFQVGFQLHHTGIKTTISSKEGVDDSNFNCTIQELKQVLRTKYEIERQFQLHHTGIKTHELHHTGIKTDGFQLHHTGIKTKRKKR